jgi:uncharacterized glyoxalase superfamily metalloenzyme YdcJ
MDYDWMQDVVTFDVHHGPELLCERLQDDRVVWMQNVGGVELVAVALGPSPDEFATLLRTVEAWVAERGLGSVDFDFDGRRYTLRAEPVLTLAA